MALVNTDFPSIRKGNLESEKMENISFEVNINDKKWLFFDFVVFATYTVNVYISSGKISRV
jgi:hypothetical protein